MTTTAILTDIRPATGDGVYLLLARCDRCSKDVMHGGGSDLAIIAGYIGHRIAHCGCDAYEITDSDGILPARVAEIREQEASRPPRRH